MFRLMCTNVCPVSIFYVFYQPVVFDLYDNPLIFNRFES